MKNKIQEAFQVIKEAYKETIKRNNEDWQPIVSTKKQLEYCMEALLNQNDRSRLKDIMFYQYAVHEFEDNDPNYAELLHKASAIVEQMKLGNL